MSQVIVIGGVVVSATLMVIALLGATDEVKIRPRLEWARIAVGIGAVIVMGQVIGSHTPPGFAIGAVALGGVLGILQGQNTVVTVKDTGLWARRGVWAIILWSAGLIGMQLAGLGTRAGAFHIGQTVALFSVSVSVGLIFGRSGPQQAARAASLGTTALLLLVAVVGLPQRDAEAQGEGVTLVTGEVQVTLTWTGIADLDLYVLEPQPDGSRINYGNRTGALGGALDVDSNASCTAGSGSFVENIAWAEGTPEGEFEIWVNNFSSCDDEGAGVQGYRIEIRADGRVVVADTGRVSDNADSNRIRIQVVNPPDGPPEIVSADGGENLDRNPPQTGDGSQGTEVDENGNPIDGGDGGDDGGVPGDEPDVDTISDEEAVAAQVAGILIAAAMGILTLAEAEQALSGVLTRAGFSGGRASQTIDRLLDQLRGDGGTPAGSNLPPPPPSPTQPSGSAGSPMPGVGGGVSPTGPTSTGAPAPAGAVPPQAPSTPATSWLPQGQGSGAGTPPAGSGPAGTDWFDPGQTSPTGSVPPSAGTPAGGSGGGSAGTDWFDSGETPPVGATSGPIPPPAPTGDEPSDPGGVGFGVWNPGEVSDPEPSAVPDGGETVADPVAPDGGEQVIGAGVPDGGEVVDDPIALVDGGEVLSDPPPVVTAPPSATDGPPVVTGHETATDPPPVVTAPESATDVDSDPAGPVVRDEGWAGPVPPEATPVGGEPGPRFPPRDGFAPSGHVFDANGVHIGYWDPTDIDADGNVTMVDLNGNPRVPAFDEFRGGGIVGLSDGPDSLSHTEFGPGGERATHTEVPQQNNFPAEVGRPEPDGRVLDRDGNVIGQRVDGVDSNGEPQTSYVDVNGDPLTVLDTADGPVVVRPGQRPQNLPVRARELPDGRVVDGDGNVLGRRAEWSDARDAYVYRDPQGRPIDVNPLPDARDPSLRSAAVGERVDIPVFDGTTTEAEHAPVPVDPARQAGHLSNNPRMGLESGVRTQWDTMGAGPNGELYAPDGTPIGQIGDGYEVLPGQTPDPQNGTIVVDGQSYRPEQVHVPMQTLDGQPITGARSTSPGRPPEFFGPDGRPVGPRGGAPYDTTPSTTTPHGNTVSSTPSQDILDRVANPQGDDGLGALADGRAAEAAAGPPPAGTRVTSSGDGTGAAPAGEATGAAARGGAAPPTGDATGVAPGGGAPRPAGDATGVAPGGGAGAAPQGDATGVPPAGDAPGSGSTTDAPPPPGDMTRVTATGDAPASTGDATRVTSTGDAPASTGDATRVTSTGDAPSAPVDTGARTPSGLDTAIGRAGDLADLAGNFRDNVTQHGMSPEEALGVGALQTGAGNETARRLAESGRGLTQTGRSITDVGGGLATGSMLPNGLDNLMPERMAANTARTLYQGAAAALSSEEGAFDEFAESVRNRPGFDPFAGWARGAEEAGRIYAGDYDDSAQATFDDHVAVAGERAEDFQQQVESGGAGSVLQGLDHVAEGAAEAWVDPANAASEAAQAIGDVAYDAAQDGDRFIAETADHFAEGARRGDFGMIPQGYQAAGDELARFADDPATYAEDTVRTFGEYGRNLSDAATQTLDRWNEWMSS